MGVRGLSTFISMNPQLNHDYKLRDTKLVIDGNNLLYSLYNRGKFDYLYGGDYNGFASYLRDFFATLKACNIEPIILLDGGDDESNKKFQTTLERSRQRLSLAQQAAKHGEPLQQLLPILSHCVFIDILNELGIKHVACAFEADASIAYVANYFECPVLSQDSDFYIFDIRNGFIRIDSVASNPETDTKDGVKSTFLRCSIYYVDTFLENFPKIDRSILPLFSTLMGNDFADGSLFDDFFSRLHLSGSSKSTKLKVGKRYSKMVDFLWWLSSRSMDEVIEIVLRSINYAERDKVRQTIDLAVKSYTQNDPHLIDILEGKCVTSTNPSGLMSFHGKALPSWFVDEFHACKLPPFLFNVVARHRLFLKAQIEDTDACSSYNCSLPIRKVIYGILLSHDLDCNDPTKNKVHEYDRRCRNLAKNVIEPCYQIDGFERLYLLKDLRSIDVQERTKMLCAVLGIEQSILAELPQNLQLYFAAVIYWARNASPRATEESLNALVICVIYLWVVKSHQSSEKSEKGEPKKPTDFKELSIEQLVQQVTELEVEKGVNRLVKFLYKPQHNNAKPLDIQVLHTFCQFRACLLHTINLNQLLGYPFQAPKIMHCINSLFLYNMTIELARRSAPDVYVSELLGRGSSLEAIFFAARSVVQKSNATAYLEKKAQKGKKNTKKKAKKAAKGKPGKAPSRYSNFVSNMFEALEDDVVLTETKRAMASDSNSDYENED